MSHGRMATGLGVLVLLTLALAPVKYLTVDVAGADLTAFRFALLVALVVAIVLTVADPLQRVAAGRVVRTRFFLATTAFAAWILLVGLYGFLSAPTALLERRAIVGSGSLLITVLVLPLVALPVLLRFRLQDRLAVPARVWQVLLAFAFVQVVLHLAGLPVNGIDPGTPATYPVAPVFGLELLRPYSLFGEPRDLASLAIPVLLAGVVLTRGRRLTLVHGLILGVLGVLLASYTFYLALALFAAYYLLFERRTMLIARGAAIVAVALVVAVPLLSSELGGSRVVTEFDDLTARPPAPASPVDPSVEPPAERPTSAAFNQTPDLLADDYARDALTGHIGAADLVAGTGIGQFTATVNRYYVRHFNYDLVRKGELVNSRLLPFGLLVEAGLVGLALLGWVIFEALRRLQLSALPPSERAGVRVLVVALLLASAVQTSVVFGVALVICLAYAWRDESSPATA